jgi:hypothetical protein
MHFLLLGIKHFVNQNDDNFMHFYSNSKRFVLTIDDELVAFADRGWNPVLCNAHVVAHVFSGNRG